MGFKTGFRLLNTWEYKTHGILDVGLNGFLFRQGEPMLGWKVTVWIWLKHGFMCLNTWSLGGGTSCRHCWALYRLMLAAHTSLGFSTESHFLVLIGCFPLFQGLLTLTLISLLYFSFMLVSLWWTKILWCQEQSMTAFL